MFSLTKIVAAVGLVATSAVAYSGDLTYYTPGLGACGFTNSEADAVVALAVDQYGSDPNPNNAAVCGRQIAINCESIPPTAHTHRMLHFLCIHQPTHVLTGDAPDNGKTAIAEVVDKCWGCASGSIDVSPTVFSQLEDLSAGRVQVSWDFI